MDKEKDMNQEKTQEDMVKEAVEEAKKAAAESEQAQEKEEEPCTGEPEEPLEEEADEDSDKEAEGADQESADADGASGEKKSRFFGKKNKKENPFVQGMDKVYKQLMTTLEGIGVKPIEAVGQEFNPDFHNAVMHVEDENFGENIIAEEFQKGYMYCDSVVRHSMVKVAN